jgi:hypothetical protein
MYFVALFNYLRSSWESAIMSRPQEADRHQTVISLDHMVYADLKANAERLNSSLPQHIADILALQTGC